MRRIKSKNTKPEKIFKSLLKKEGIRYSTTNDKLPGKPDFILKSHKTAIFIDGEFWHGFKWKQKQKRLKKNRNYWLHKIKGNITRDKKNRTILESNGWTVLRFWEQEVHSKPKKCIEEIRSTY